MTNLLMPLLMAFAASDAAGVVVSTLDGRTLTGSVVEWTAESVSIETGDGRQRLATSELLSIHREGADAQPSAASDELPHSAMIELVDDARIAIGDVMIKDRVATVATDYSDGQLRIPTEKIRLVHVQPPSAAFAAAWQELGRKELAGDVLLVTKRDGASVDYLTGIVGDVTSDRVDFKWDGERVPVKRNKVAAIAFYHAQEADLPEAVCTIVMADGSRLPAGEISLVDGRLRITTPAGVEFEAPLEELSHADFSSGKLVYLSDLDPIEVSWTPRVGPPPGAELLGAHGRPRNDLSFSGSPLALWWKEGSKRELRTYSKGLAIRSRTELSYRLPRGMQRFVAIAGIDPTTASQGHVTLEIRGDEQILWQGEIDGRDQPVELDLDLAQARRLHLRVDYGKNLDYGDRLHLVEARVTK